MFDFISNLIETTGAFGVGLVMFLENVFPPIPSELVMPLAGFNAARGNMSLIAIFIAGTLGSMLGAYLWYEVGRRLGCDRLLQFVGKYGIWLTLGKNDIHNAIDWFERHDRSATFFGRMIPGVRTLISVPAGLSGMSVPQFLAYTAAGSSIWNVALIASGYLLKANYDKVQTFLNPVTTVIIVLIVAGYLYRVGKQLLARRRTD